MPRGGRPRTDAHRRHAGHDARPTTRPGHGPVAVPSHHRRRRSWGGSRPRARPQALRAVQRHRRVPATRTAELRGRRAASRHRDRRRSSRVTRHRRPPYQRLRRGRHRAHRRPSRRRKASSHRHPDRGSRRHHGGCRSCAGAPGHRNSWARRCSSVLLDRSSTHHGPTVSTTCFTSDRAHPELGDGSTVPGRSHAHSVQHPSGVSRPEDDERPTP